MVSNLHDTDGPDPPPPPAPMPTGRGRDGPPETTRPLREAPPERGAPPRPGRPVDMGHPTTAPRAESPPEPPPVPVYKRRWFIPLISVVALIAVIGGLFWWWYSHTYVSTDDAYTAGHTVSISAQVPGRVDKVYVDDNQDVKQGEVLVELDPRDYESNLSQAQAALKVNQAEADRANAVLARYEAIRNSAAVSPQDYEETVAAARKANAQVVAGQAAVAAAQLQLAYTKVTAPFTGRIARKSIEPGAYVQPGQAMMALVDPRVWVEANFKETQLKRIKPGDPVRIKVDAYPDLILHGHVDSIQPGSGATFSLLPPENATGNFVKVVQRVPVKIVFDDYAPDHDRRLGVGMSVQPRVKVR